MKKRIFALVLAAAMVLGLAACGGGSSATTPAPAASTTQAPAATTKAPEASTTKAPEASTTKAPEASTTKAPEATTAAPAEETTAAPEPGPVGPAEIVQKRTVTFASSNCGTLNPHQANSNEDDFQTYTCVFLYRRLPTGEGTREMRCDLAESEPVQMDAEGKVWQIKVKPGLTFVDYTGADTGKPINAESFVYSWKMALDPKLKQRAGDNMSIYVTFVNAPEYYKQTAEKPVDWESVGIKAVDDLTIELTLTTASNALNVMKAFTGYGTIPVDPEFYASFIAADGATTEYGTDITKAYYCGGFYPTEWVKESKIVLKKNAYYANADWVKLSDVVLQYVDSYQTQVELFLSGEMDVAGLNSELGFAYADSPYYVSYPSRYLTQIEIYDPTAWYERDTEGKLIKHTAEEEKIDIALPILCDLDFKNALYYAIDRETLANLCLSTPATYIIPDTSEALEDGTLFRDTPEAAEYRLSPDEAYNEALAKEYYDKAVATDAGKSFKDGKLTLELIISSSNTEMRRCAEYLQEQLPKVFGDSFKLEINEMPSQQRLDSMKNWRTAANTFQLALSNWSRAATDESPYNQLDVFSSSFWAKCNAPYHCETVEELIYLQRTDPQVKMDRQYNTELAAQMEKAALEEKIVIPMYEKTVQYLVGDAIELVDDPEEVGALYLWLSDVIE